jgi:hypothetical protein
LSLRKKEQIKVDTRLERRVAFIFTGPNRGFCCTAQIMGGQGDPGDDHQPSGCLKGFGILNRASWRLGITVTIVISIGILLINIIIIVMIISISIIVISIIVISISVIRIIIIIIIIIIIVISFCSPWGPHRP